MKYVVVYREGKTTEQFIFIFILNNKKKKMYEGGETMCAYAHTLGQTNK